MLDLDMLAKECHAHFSSEMSLENEHISFFQVNVVLAHLAKWYGTEVVLYGGQTATPLFFGFKKMRSLTNDLDFAVSEAVMPRLIEKEKLEYHEKYQVFFTHFKETLCVFTSGRIHNWEIPDDFFSSAVHFSVQDKVAAICAPEYTIALKLRRAFYNDYQLFGKDAIDILNLLAAPLFREDLPEVKMEKAAQLALQYAGYRSPEMLDQILPQVNHVPETVRKRVKARLLDFKRYLEAGIPS